MKSKSASTDKALQELGLSEEDVKDLEMPAAPKEVKKSAQEEYVAFRIKKLSPSIYALYRVEIKGGKVVSSHLIKEDICTITNSKLLSEIYKLPFERREKNAN